MAVKADSVWEWTIVAGLAALIVAVVWLAGGLVCVVMDALVGAA